LQANHPDIIRDFVRTFQGILGKNDALLNLIGRVPLADYINIINS
jgi:hypothetical protein